MFNKFEFESLAMQHIVMRSPVPPIQCSLFSLCFSTVAKEKKVSWNITFVSLFDVRTPAALAPAGRWWWSALLAPFNTNTDDDGGGDSDGGGDDDDLH